MAFKLRKIKKHEFMEMFVKPFIKKGDKPFNRQVFATGLDSAEREGLVTENQAKNWSYPKNKYFE